MGEQNPSTFLLRPAPAPTPALRVVLIHHAGGSHVEYRKWIRHFPGDWEVCLVGLPGRGKLAGQPAVTDWRELIARLAGELRPLTSTPFAIFGHSMGAIIAYDLVCELRRQGLPLPRWLGLSGHAAPAEEESEPDSSLLPGPELRSLVGDLGGLPEQLLRDDVVWSLMEPVLRNDLRLLQDRRPTRRGEPPLPLPISVFCGTYDTIAGPAQVANWSAHTERFLWVHAFPGDHFYFRRTRSEVVGQIVGDLRALVPC